MRDAILSYDDIIHNIFNRVHFEGYASDRAFYIKIERYEPYACFAIHNGHQLRPSLAEKILLKSQERWYEEDPLTGEFISTFPMVVIANDSRYEYDLNRSENECIYEEAWGKKVWKTNLSEGEREISLEKHRNFYGVVDALVRKMLSLFGTALIYDIHSYNYQRYEKDFPVFNLGTELINNTKFKTITRHWLKELGKMALPNIVTTTGENTLFKGKGYLLKYITGNFDNTLVLATEIKKVYCNENTGEVYPLVVSALRNGFKKAVLRNVAFFLNNNSSMKITSPARLLSRELQDDVIMIDKELVRLVRNFEILHYVNPLNIEQEKRKFLKSGFKYEPQFRYSQLEVDPFVFRRKLYALPLDKVRDVSIQHMYKDVINAYADKIDIITSIGTDRFLYNSLRYYGEPAQDDIANAEYLLSLPEAENSDKSHEEVFTANEARNHFEEQMKDYGFHCRIELSNKIIARAIVINHKQLLLIKRGAKFSRRDMDALFHHEIGIHMLTTMNSLTQPLQVMNIGLPVNDLTQEGLAIMSEYCSGNIGLGRLKELALRVLGTRYMVKGYSFQKVFAIMKDEYGLSDDRAFYMVSRIYRGGGFTKDYLYLRGFRDLLKFREAGYSLEPLLIGKTSLAYVSLLNEMIERKLLFPPKYKTIAFADPKPQDPILQYIISGIK